jgi:hypothetical protein
MKSTLQKTYTGTIDEQHAQMFDNYKSSQK